MYVYVYYYVFTDIADNLFAYIYFHIKRKLQTNHNMNATTTC